MSRLLLRLLCVVLFVFQPMTFAVELTQALPMLSFRGPVALLELVVHGIVAALSCAAGWSLWNSLPHGPGLARLALTCMAAVSVQSLYWSALPSQTRPGSELPLAVLAIAHSVAWIAFLYRTSHNQDQLSNHFA
jgi:hypothetical protein